MYFRIVIVDRICTDIWLLHVMYFYKLYPAHMWYKHLASILAASGSLTKLAFLQNLRLRRCSPKQNWRHHPWSKGPGPATYKIKHNVVRGRPWGPCSSRVSALVAVGFAHASWGRRHPWFFAEKTTVQRTSQGGTMPCRIWVFTRERRELPSKIWCKLKSCNNAWARYPKISQLYKLGSRLDGTSGMVPRWVATCQLNQLHFCVFWALVGLFLWSHVLGHQRNRDQTLQLLWSTLKIFEVLPYFIVLLHFEQHRYFGAMDDLTWHLTTGTLSLLSNPKLKPSMAFQRKASMFKFVLPKCPVLPHC